MTTLSDIVLQTITLAGTFCDIEQVSSLSRLPDSTEYQQSYAPVYSQLPCRRVLLSGGTDPHAPTHYNQSATRYLFPAVTAAFYLPTVWQGQPLTIDPSAMRLRFEGKYYDILRLEQPSGGTPSGQQLSYTCCYCALPSPR